MKVVVLSDIHANYFALDEALKIIDQSGYDMMIILGDILTYGVNIDPVVETIGNRLKEKNTFLIKGNHDEIYDDIFAGIESPYLRSLPDWLRESIDFTAKNLKKSNWDDLKFLENMTQDGIYYSHANPFSERNWSYLNNSSKLEEASKILRKMKLRAGVFGHIHRVLNSTFSEKNILKKNNLESASLSNKKIYILNTGSIGQPRDKNNLKSSLLWLNIKVPSSNNSDGYKYDYKIEFFNYSLKHHLNSIESTSLSYNTKEKLISFFNKKK